MGDAWLWWFFIQMLGLACVPLAFSVFANLPDRGYALAKALGVLSFGFLVWFPLTLPSILPGGLSALALPYSQATIMVFLLLLVAGNIWLLRYRWREITRFARQHPAYIVLSETLFGSAFAFLIWLRSFSPEIANTEKFMDEAFLSAIMRSPHLPPNDPWLSGYSLNYYYLGHFLLATIAKLLGTAPAIAFNTGIALIFALMAVNLFGVTTNVAALLRLHRQRRAGATVRLNLLAAAPFGLAAVLLSLVFGNLAGASQWLAQLGAAVSFNGGLQNVLALTLAAASLFGLVWSVVSLLRPRFWRLKSRLEAAPPPIRVARQSPPARAGTNAPRLTALLLTLAFGLATLVLVPWAVSRLEGIGAWLGIASPLIAAWFRHLPMQTSYDWWVYWWNPSRAVQSSPTDYGNITEFPAFSFSLADLHAHVLALPFTVLALGVALNLLLARGRGLAAFGPTNGWRALRLVSGAVILGGLYAINGWDLPTYVGLALLCLAVQQWRAHGRQFNRAVARDFFTMAACWIVLGLLLYLPFILSFSSPSQGIGTIPPTVPDASGQLVPRSILPTDRTSFSDFWSMFGLFLSILGAFLLWQFALAFITRWRAASAERALALSNGAAADAHADSEDSAEDAAKDAAAEEQVEAVPLGPLDAVLPLVAWGLLAAAIALALLTFVSYSLVLVICLAGVTACGVLAYRRLHQPGLAFALITAGTALALVGGCEVIYLRDVFDHGELFRMNTIFKFYYQAWTLLSLSGGALLYELLGTGWRISWQQSPRRERLREEGMAEQPAKARLAVAGASVGEQRETAGALVASEVSEALAATGARLEGEAAAPAMHEAAQQEAAREGDAGANESQPENDGHSYSRDVPAGRNGHADGAVLPPTRRLDVLTPRDALSPGLRALGLSGKLIWMVGFLVLVLGALVYPVFAPNARTGHYQQQVGLDGAQYLTTLYPGDAAAIGWINAHITGDPVIVEATGGEYSDYARISTFTGLPTILGWAGHEIQWRVNWLNVPANAADFNRRAADLDTIYSSTDAGLVMQLLQHYQASYLYVGTLERQKYPNVDLGHFSQPSFSRFLKPVYQAEGVTIYQIS